MKTSPKVTLKMKTTPKTKNMKTYLDCICNFSPDYHRKKTALRSKRIISIATRYKDPRPA